MMTNVILCRQVAIQNIRKNKPNLYLKYLIPYFQIHKPTSIRVASNMSDC